MLVDGGFANALQILHKLLGWFTRQVGWNGQQTMITENPRLIFFNSSLFFNSAQPTSTRLKATPSMGT
jgi:hypothetical protein